MQCDIKGREIKAGDLLKIPHFTAALRRKKVYMYKLVCRVDDNIVYPDTSELPVAAVMLYHVGEEQQALACRVVSDETADLPNAGVWFVDIEEAQDLLDIFDSRVLIETVSLDPIRERS